MNLDMQVKRFPENGETSLSSTYTMLPGGKGANQSLAAVRAGASKTALVGHVGDDGPGLRILQNLKRNGVMTSGIAKSVDFPTGIATIVSNKEGERRTMLALGANSLISADQAPHDIFREKNLLLTQLEVPLEQNALVMKAAHDKGSKVILHASPMTALPLPVLHLADYLILNQARILKFAKGLNIESKNEIEAMKAIAQKAKLTCVCYDTKGRAMLVSADGKGFRFFTKTPLKVVDLSGAEDCFCGTFTACIHEGKSHVHALHMAATGYALVAGQQGGVEIYPYIDGLTEEMERYGSIEPI